jgi:hypothetical protein
MVQRVLGRAPEAAFDVVVRDAAGWPVVIRNAPFLADGTPMPTRYWLVGRETCTAVSRLEAAGGVQRAEAEVGAAAIAAAHARYAAERDAAIDALRAGSGPRPSGGVGGTRTGVKCLHAHYAWFLAGGDDPVGRWVHTALGADAPPTVLHLCIDATSTRVLAPGLAVTVPVGAHSLADELVSDPPRPEELLNAIGVVQDHLDDVLAAAPFVDDVLTVVAEGECAVCCAAVELGAMDPVRLHGMRMTRDTVEEVFRTLATETLAARVHNPGLPREQAAVIVGGMCLLVGVMRRLQAEALVVAVATTPSVVGA